MIWISPAGKRAARAGAGVSKDAQAVDPGATMRVYTVTECKVGWEVFCTLMASAFAEPPSVLVFVQGYAETAVVEVTVGTPAYDAGAGNFWATVPVALRVTTTRDTVQVFAGCIEVCDGRPSDDEQGLITSDRYCPWSATVIRLERLAPTP